MDTSDTSDDEGCGRATRRIRTLEEKLRILEEAARPGASVAAVARQHDLNSNLLFAWRRLQRRGLLEGQRHAPPLLPVTISSPTLTPTRRSNEVAAVTRTRGQRPVISTAESCIEIVIASDTRIRLHGAAQRAVLARLLEWLPRR